MRGQSSPQRLKSVECFFILCRGSIMWKNIKYSVFHWVLLTSLTKKVHGVIFRYTPLQPPLTLLCTSLVANPVKLFPWKLLKEKKEIGGENFTMEKGHRPIIRVFYWQTKNRQTDGRTDGQDNWIKCFSTLSLLYPI